MPSNPPQRRRIPASRIPPLRNAKANRSPKHPPSTAPAQIGRPKSHSSTEDTHLAARKSSPPRRKPKSVTRNPFPPRRNPISAARKAIPPWRNGVMEHVERLITSDLRKNTRETPCSAVAERGTSADTAFVSAALCYWRVWLPPWTTPLAARERLFALRRRYRA